MSKSKAECVGDRQKSKKYRSEILADFDNASEVYDQLAHVQQAHYLELYDLAAPFLKSVELKKALDIGSGSGLGLQRLRQYMATKNRFRLTWFAVDLSLAMLQRHSEPCVVAGDMNKLPFSNDSFDLVLSNFALHWSLDLQEVIQEMNRVVSARGLVVIGVPVLGSLGVLEEIWTSVGLNSPLHPMPDADEIIRLCEQSNKILAVQKTNIPLRFNCAKECFAWLRQTGVTRKKSALEQVSQNITKNQYQLIQEKLTTLLVTQNAVHDQAKKNQNQSQQKELQFCMLDIILHAQGV